MPFIPPVINTPVSGFEMVLPTQPSLYSTTNNDTKKSDDKPQSSSIKKGRWGILIPYEVKNKHIIWGHQSLWSQQWEAPIRINGYRIITDMGDYIDKKNIENLLLHPDSNLDNIVSVEDRYNADSLILLKLENDKLDINVIMPNDEDNNATEDLTNNDLTLLKQNSLQDLNNIYKNYKNTYQELNNNTDNRNNQTTISQSTQIDFQELPKTNDDLHFSIVMDSSRMDIAQKMKDIIPQLPNIKIENIDFDNTGIEIIGFFSGDKNNFVSLLKNKGFPIGE
jgi:hypothetical protein